MNWDRIEGKWKQSTGRVKQKWGKLTDDDLTMIAGSRDRLIGKIQERYGVAKDAAERQVNDFINAYDASGREPSREERDSREREDVHTGRRN